MDITYQQILAEEYEESAKDLLVQPLDYDYDKLEDYNVDLYDENELEDKEEFNKFHGDRNKPEHVIKPKPDPSSLHRQQVRVKTQIVNIDSKFRGNIVPDPSIIVPTCNGNTMVSEASLISGTSSSYFIYYPNRPYKNIKSVKITSLEFPNTFYTFSATRGNTTFKTYTYGLLGFDDWTLPDGNYTIQQIVSNLNAQIALTSVNFQFNYNANTNKVYITSTNKNFAFNFIDSTEGPNNNGFGYNLGFLLSNYTPASSNYTWDGTTATYTAENIPDTIQDNYIYVVINDYNLINHPIYGQTTIEAFAKITLQTGKNTIIFDNNFTNSSSKIFNFQQPTNITKFEIKFIDAYGNILDLNGGHVSITLELDEILDSAIYENMIQF